MPVLRITKVRGNCGASSVTSMKRANTATANGIGSHVETAAKPNGFRSVDDVHEARFRIHLPDRPLKKAGTHDTVGFDHDRYPWRITQWSDWLALSPGGAGKPGNFLSVF